MALPGPLRITTDSIAQNKQICFHYRIMLLALHIALILSTTLSFDQEQFKHNSYNGFSPDSHVTISRIQQTQDARSQHALSISTQ